MVGPMAALVAVACLGQAPRMNVLMLGVDDLRPAGAFFGDPEVKLPNLDRLAARATVFTQAYVQAATCGVSRSSLLTSRRPDTNFVLGNTVCPFTTAPAHNAWQSLPEYFRASGYATAGFGKIFHPDTCDGAAVGERKQAWSLPYYHAPCISLGSIYNGSCYESYPGPLPEGPGGKVTSIYKNTSLDAADDTMPDGMIAAEAVKTLKSFAGAGTKNHPPFFMAVGFHKPHLPHIAPSKYFDMYPLESVSLPPDATRQAPKAAPNISWNACGEFKSYADTAAEAKREGFAKDNHFDDLFTRRQRQAYFAAASYTDAQIGKVLDELEAQGLANSTVVTLWGDHGWHLGENNEWAKHTAMTRANRAPLLFAHPAHGGKVSQSFAEFVDIYPTLADLAGLPVPKTCADEAMSQSDINCTEGYSLRPLIEDGGGGGGGGKPAAFSQWPKGGKMGYIIFTSMTDGSQVRYTEWVGYDKDRHGPIWADDSAGNELYNRSGDPDETENVVAVPALAGEVKRLSAMLHAGWRTVNFPNLPTPPPAPPPSSPPLPPSTGCFDDESSTRRDMPLQLPDSPGMTPWLCIAMCRAAGLANKTMARPYKYAGVQNGDACFCGDAVGRFGKAAAGTCCLHPCAGNPGITCGGHLCHDVYTVQDPDRRDKDHRKKERN